MGIKIQINSLEALEILIGLEMQIRESVVQDFTKKHLKSLAKTALVADIAKAVQSEVKAEFFEEVKVGNWNKTEVIFKREVLAKIKDDLSYRAETELRGVVSDLIEEQKVKKTITEKLKDATEWIIEELAPQRLKDKIDKLVEVRLKEKLGIK